MQVVTGHDEVDVQARLRVRWDELHESFRLLRHAVARLLEYGSSPASDELRSAASMPDGRGLGWAEAPQGEVVYALEVRRGRIVRCLARSASFHNLLLFHDVFHGDVLTDFPFIEASFGLSPAGVAM